MAEVIDDTETGTITLDAVCDNPRADINRDGLVDGDDQILLGAAYGSSPGDANWNPDADINQDGIVDSTDLAILGANMGCTFERPAHGDIVELDVPVSAGRGESYDITAKTNNDGGSSGTFKMQLLINGAIESTSEQFTLAAGATSTDKIPAATAPTSGTSMTYEIKCSRVT